MNLSNVKSIRSCAVCGDELKIEPRDSVVSFLCYRCGEFSLPNDFVKDCAMNGCWSFISRDKDGFAKLMYALRTMLEKNKKVELSNRMVDAILAKPLPRPQEQADLLIRWLAEHTDNSGDRVSLKPIENSLSIIGANNRNGIILVLSHLINIGLVKGKLNKENTINSEDFGELVLTFDGWNHYETLLKGTTTYRKAFMAMKFGDAELNAVLENVFKPSVKMAGFDLFKLDDEPRAGLIDDRLRVEIQSSAFLIADLTHANNGAYWEAGYAEGLGKPVIYTCEKEQFDSPQKTHFDTNHHLTVIWDRNAPKQAGDLLKATIRATLPHLAKLED